MGDSIQANPWREDPDLGGLVSQNIELRHASGVVRWSTPDGVVSTLRSSDGGPVDAQYQFLQLGTEAPDGEVRAQLEARAGGYGNLLELIARSDGSTESRIASKLLYDSDQASRFVQTAYRGAFETDVNLSLRAGAHVIPAVAVSALGAADFTVPLAAGGTPDHVFAQLTDGGDLYYGFSVSGTGDYTATSFAATVQNHIDEPFAGGSMWLNYLALYFDLGG